MMTLYMCFFFFHIIFRTSDKQSEKPVELH